MSLRDELWTMLEPHFAIMSVAFPDKPIDRYAHVEKWAQFIERALAAGRAATIDECKCALDGGIQPAAWNIINGLPSNRPALDALLAQARTEGMDDVLTALGDAVEELLPGVGLKWNVANHHASALAWLKSVLAQARADQSEKNIRAIRALIDDPMVAPYTIRRAVEKLEPHRD